MNNKKNEHFVCNLDCNCNIFSLLLLPFTSLSLCLPLLMQLNSNYNLFEIIIRSVYVFPIMLSGLLTRLQISIVIFFIRRQQQPQLLSALNHHIYTLTYSHKLQPPTYKGSFLSLRCLFKRI